jgi:hypothetical protein
MSESLGLAEAVQQLRSEIGKAQLQGAQEDLKFLVTGIELELGFEFTTSKEGSAGIKVPVIALEVGGKISGSEKTNHKVKLQLQIAGPGDGQRAHQEIAGSAPPPMVPRP